MASISSWEPYSTPDPKHLAELQKLKQEMAALKQAQYNAMSAQTLGQGLSAQTSASYSNAFYSGMATGTQWGKGAKTPASVNISSPKKAREINTGSVLRGINGLLYKIAEMKGR